jgi:hypothetical protein
LVLRRHPLAGGSDSSVPTRSMNPVGDLLGGIVQGGDRMVQRDFM